MSHRVDPAAAIHQHAVPRSWMTAIAACVVAFAWGVRAYACDVCAIYTATEQRESRPGFRIGVAEQFTRFTRLKDDGKTIDNPGEHLNSSITQLILGYDVNSRFGVQFAL